MINRTLDIFEFIIQAFGGSEFMREFDDQTKLALWK